MLLHFRCQDVCIFTRQEAHYFVGMDVVKQVSLYTIKNFNTPSLELRIVYH